MDEQHKVAFAVFMGKLSAMLPNAVVPKETVEAYREALADLPFEVVKVAAKQCAAEMSFHNSPNMRLPSIGEIRTKAATLMGQAEALPSAGAAWSQLARHLTLFINGFEWRNKDQVHPLLIRAAQEFGEYRFVTRETENAGTDFAQFERIYNALVQRHNQLRLALPETRAIVTALADGFRARLPAPSAPKAQDAAPAPSEARPTATGGARVAQVLREALASTSPKTRAQADREAAQGRLRTRAYQLEQWLESETDPDRRAAYQGLLDNTRRMLAQSDTTQPQPTTQLEHTNGR